MRKESVMRRLLFLGSIALLIGVPGVGAADDYLQRCLGSGTTIRGTYAGETIYGTNNRDTISALSGDDSVHALAGEDRVCGFDTLYLCPDGAADTSRNVERVVETSLGCR